MKELLRKFVEPVDMTEGISLYLKQSSLKNLV